MTSKRKYWERTCTSRRFTYEDSCTPLYAFTALPENIKYEIVRQDQRDKK